MYRRVWGLMTVLTCLSEILQNEVPTIILCSQYSVPLVRIQSTLWSNLNLDMLKYIWWRLPEAEVTGRPFLTHDHRQPQHLHHLPPLREQNTVRPPYPVVPPDLPSKSHNRSPGLNALAVRTVRPLFL